MIIFNINKGDAENLQNIKQLKEERIDLIINIESSHCYVNYPKFIDSAY